MVVKAGMTRAYSEFHPRKGQQAVRRMIEGQVSI